MTEETLILRPGEGVVVRRAEPAMLEVTAAWDGGHDKPPPHLHPAQDERFEVLEGALHRDGDTYRAGEVFEIPRGTVHRVWATEPTRAMWQVRPALRTLEFFRAVDQINRRYLNPRPLRFAPILREYRDVFQIPRLPRPVLLLLAELQTRSARSSAGEKH